ncbi:MAG: 50S ribosomal protein L10 [Candidatus Delongbacteria bacterium]
MPTPKKEAVVQELGSRLKRAKAVYVADYSHMNVTTLTELRNELRKADAEIQIVKNNLIRLSLADTPWANAGKDLHGPCSLTLAYGEAPVVAKVLKRFAAYHKERPVVKAIGFEDSVHGGEFLGTLASMPTRQEALGMLAGVLNSIIASFARALNAVADKTTEAGTATPGAALTQVSAPAATAEPAPVAAPVEETAPDASPEAAGEEAEGGAEA